MTFPPSFLNRSTTTLSASVSVFKSTFSYSKTGSENSTNAAPYTSIMPIAAEGGVGSFLKLPLLPSDYGNILPPLRRFFQPSKFVSGIMIGRLTG